MKIFLDCSDAELVRTYYETGLVDGVTTNPRHVAQADDPLHEVIDRLAEIRPV